MKNKKRAMAKAKNKFGLMHFPVPLEDPSKRELLANLEGSRSGVVEL